MQFVEIGFETDFVDQETDNLVECLVFAKATFDSKFGADRDQQRGVLELVDLDLRIEVRNPFRSKYSLDQLEGFPLLQKAIYNHCKQIAKEKVFQARIS